VFLKPFDSGDAAGVVCAEHHTRSQRLFSGPPGIDHIEVREDYPHISLY
jgi:hypothetical protein